MRHPLGIPPAESCPSRDVSAPPYDKAHLAHYCRAASGKRDLNILPNVEPQSVFVGWNERWSGQDDVELVNPVASQSLRNEAPASRNGRVARDDVAQSRTKSGFAPNREVHNRVCGSSVRDDSPVHYPISYWTQTFSALAASAPALPLMISSVIWSPPGYVTSHGTKLVNRPEIEASMSSNGLPAFFRTTRISFVVLLH